MSDAADLDPYPYRPLPPSLTISPSLIDGLGLHAVETIGQDTILGVTHVRSKGKLWRTPLGGFINHNNTGDANCFKQQLGDLWMLRTLRTIPAGTELTVTYTLAPVPT